MKSSIGSFRFGICVVGALLAAGPLVAESDKDKDKPGNGDDGKGRQKGLVAHYFRDPIEWNGLWPNKDSIPKASPEKYTFTTYAYSRVEPLINHHFINEGWFSVRWVGYIDLSETGKVKGSNGVAEVTFRIWADDGCRLFVDGVKLIDSWKATWEESPDAWRTSPVVKLTDGPHRIVIEYFQGQSQEKGDKDPIKLHWLCPGRGVDKDQIIPAAYFSHTDADMTNITGK